MKALNSRNIFLVDAIGACLSAIILLLVFPNIKDWIGMPLPWLQLFGICAFIFAIYSFACYFRADWSRSKCLFLIMTANALYCFLTLAVLLNLFEEITLLGKLYFLGEILVILSLVFVERKVFNNEMRSQ